MDELELLKKRVSDLELEVQENKSVSLQSITHFLDLTRGNLQFPKRTTLPATCSTGEVVEVSGSFYQCVAQDTWNRIVGDYVGTAGETIDTSSASKFVYLKASDSKIYLVDSDADESTFKFVGVVAMGTSVSANASVRVITSGIAGGFTGLTAGDRLYPSATAGTAGTTPVDTQAVELGFAVSTTQVFVMPRSPHIVGGASGSSASTNDETKTVTLGFRPRAIFFLGRVFNAAGEFATGWGFWCDGNTYAFNEQDDPVSDFVLSTTHVVFGNLTNTGMEITILNATSTGFDILYNRINVNGSNATGDVYYLAIS